MTNMNWGSFIPAEYAEGLKNAAYQEILLYSDKNRHNMTARNLLATRNVGPLVDVDSIIEVKSSGQRASIIAKGSAPDTADVFGRQRTWPMYQLSMGFRVHERDIAKDPKLQTRNVDVIEREIHRLEDNLFINGDAAHNIIGLATAAAANPNGVIAATGGTYNNKGSWDGAETGSVMDPYSDINLAFALQKPDFRMSDNKLLMSTLAMSYLFELDSERQSFADKICGLFRKAPGDYSYMWASDLVPAGHVYIVPKDIQAAELVFSEDITVDTDFPKDTGGNYFIKLYEWLSIQIYQNDAFVDIAIT